MSVSCKPFVERSRQGEGLALLKRPLKFKRGDKGPFIVDIQEMFAKLGFDPGEPEGVFVAKTEDAVRVFQSEYGLDVTGIIDAKTLKLLYEEADPEGYPAALIEGQRMHPEEHDEPGESEKSGQGSAGERQVAGREPTTPGEGATTGQGPLGDKGPRSHRGSIAVEGTVAKQGLIADRQTAGHPRPMADQGRAGDEEFTDDKESMGDQKPIAGKTSAGDQGFTHDEGSATDQGSVDDQPPADDQGPAVDAGLGADEQPVAGLAEVRPTMATGSTDSAIVISLSERALGLYQGNQLIRRYPVAIGKPSTPTPVGTHRVLEKVLYPGGGLGTRWIGFTYQMHGIHGTNRPELIGQEVSNGCVRMHNANVEELYERINVGTPVVVIVAPVQSWSGLGKPTSQSGPGAGQPGTGSGQAGKPGGLFDPAGPQPKDPKETSQAPSPAASHVGSSASGSGPGRTYTVQPGDSIWAIAKRFGTTVEALVSINKIRNPELIYPGEVLEIP